MADEVVTDISVVLRIHDREAITVRIDPEGMCMPVDNDLELYREITLFEAFTFECPQLEISHPENIVKQRPVFTTRFCFMAGTARWIWNCGGRISISAGWSAPFFTTRAANRLLLLINFTMPFFGSRQPFAVAAAVTRIC